MADPIKHRLAGHALIHGGRGVMRNYPDVAICECRAESLPLATVAERRTWHQEHKADVLDTWVARGRDDRGREVHL